MSKIDPKSVRPSKKASRFRAVSLVTAVALAIMWQTGMVSNWRTRGDAPKPKPVALVPAQSASNATGIVPPIPKGNDSSISPVPLQLILVHVQLGESAKEGSAEIGVIRESPQTYQVGALLENGARLAEIHTNYVLLQRAGHSARLYLDSVSATDQICDTNMLAVGGPKEAPPPAEITSRQILTDYIRPSPVYEGDALVGYQVFPGAKRAPGTQMGLQQGDLIVEINDVPLTDPATSWGFLRSLADGDVLSVVVKRSTGVQQLTLDGTLLVRAEESRRQAPVQAMLVPPIQ